jgi:hypothetical protein
MNDISNIDSLVHYKIVRSFLEIGRAATRAELSDNLHLTAADVDASLRRLDASHSLVLHPHVVEPWVVHPFATSPTLTWVQQGQRGWWAPCIWCGLGIATLAGSDATIHSRMAGESDDIDIHVHDGEVKEEIWVHFPEPPRLAWGNVHHFCARLLPFPTPDAIEPWTKRHGFPLGAIIPIQQLAALARVWYGSHANAHWKKWSLSEAAEIFRQVGLQGAFWSLESGAGVY